MSTVVKESRKAGISLWGLASAGEGILAGLAGGIGQKYLPLALFPLAMLTVALYTALRVKNIRPCFYLGGFLAGYAVLTFPAISGVLIPLGVILAGYLSSGAHFFATHYRAFRSWPVTAAWALLAALLAVYVFPSFPGIVLTLLFFTCLIPLWAASLRAIHALCFALFYLLVLHLAGFQGYFSWPFWVTIFGVALIPELMALLYPERTFKLDSLPVITPTLTFGQKLKGVAELFFLLIDFYAFTVEKFIKVKNISFGGKALAAAGILFAVVSCLPSNFHVPLLVSLLFFVTGSLLLLAAADYGWAGAVLALYGLVAGVGRGNVWVALFLVFLGAVLFFGRPRETKQERDRWKELNKV
jgi:hypothetical protein